MVNVEIRRREIFDPSQQVFVKEELPTITVKDAVRVRNWSPGTALISKDLGAGTEMRITFYRVSAGTPTEFYMRDRGGTFDYPFLESPGAEAGISAPNEPLHVVRGTFEMGLINAGTVGTFIAAYEGIIRYQGTETWD
jgi:hypothetical protein